LAASAKLIGNCAAASASQRVFFTLLPIDWDDISEEFRNDIMDGVANYLAHHMARIMPWQPNEEPDAPFGATVIDRLEGTLRTG
jgi:hypothetical protein